jgi:hypothetical protein
VRADVKTKKRIDANVNVNCYFAPPRIPTGFHQLEHLKNNCSHAEPGFLIFREWCQSSVVSSHPVETTHWSQKWGETTSRAGKNRWRTGKMTCKSMKQDKNEQNYKKGPTLVVGKKSNGKY